MKTPSTSRTSLQNPSRMLKKIWFSQSLPTSPIPLSPLPHFCSVFTTILPIHKRKPMTLTPCLGPNGTNPQL